MGMTHRHMESWTAYKQSAWLTMVQDKLSKQEMQERKFELFDYINTTNTAIMIRCKRTAVMLPQPV